MTYGKYELTKYGVSSAPLEGDALEPEQGLLALEPPGVAGQAPVRPDHAVAREDDRDRVAIHCAADRARGLRAAHLRREGAVRGPLTERDPRELVEHLLVEGVHVGEVGLEVELVAAAREVLVQ